MVYDESNWLEVRRGERYALRLLVTSDGASHDCEVLEPFSRHSYPVRSHVSDIQHIDAGHVWILTYPGPMAGDAFEFDLAACLVVRKFQGYGFSLSPDRRHVAFKRAGRGTWQQDNECIFVDGLMVFPVVSHFDNWSDGTPRHGTSVHRDTSYGMDVPWEIADYGVESDLQWTGDSTLECIVREAMRSRDHGSETPEFYRLEVTGISDESLQAVAAGLCSPEVATLDSRESSTEASSRVPGPEPRVRITRIRLTHHEN